MCQKCVFGPVPSGGAYSALLGPLAGFRGPTSKRKGDEGERRGRKRRQGKGRGGEWKGRERVILVFLFTHF